ncbi:alkaline shock response membrane anchor protein AmaP [Desulfoscipio geothermicus]|uniref:Asp23 family, cell envelope-related function n=1 Tax=Desulfoscipio geothermicus DSM 3669 TaxID=1121426 RepID=A0A1I6DB27_9FIRM|nr:alkaline shock response membrane anchor protein AmaP [Desulfoscipio geothermicus]SFR02653.1 Asp23 family, cell envelope-related function [Desulfoscipio geothermicus DSM 3669]
MGPFDRGILAIYTFTLTLLFLALAAYLAGWPEPVQELWQEMQLPGQEEITWALLGVYVLMGVRLLWSGFKGERKKQAIVHEGNLGQVRVSLPAVESLSEKVVSAVQGVKEVRARVEAVPQGIAVNLRIVTTPDINIPRVAEDMQRQVKESIYDIVGISVHEVRVTVESFFARKPRVE